MAEFNRRFQVRPRNQAARLYPGAAEIWISNGNRAPVG